mmetsp:Transcript_16406/g.14089  ORF Transcript_16406/g.14089 Transcript_16406/m.14089 type:complete len:115 (+) Transcript_16406:240-584(+)
MPQVTYGKLNPSIYLHNIEFENCGNGNYNPELSCIIVSKINSQNNVEIKGISIHESTKRGIHLKGSSGTLIQQNVIYNTEGIGLFLQEGSEINNVIDGNIVLNPLSSNTLTAAD